MRLPTFLILILISALRLNALDPTKDFSPKHGLCVVLPATDGEFLCRLAKSGNALVHGVVENDADLQNSRALIQSRGLYGLVTVSKPLSLTALPFADNLVNVIICDLDSLKDKSLTAKEIMRVLQPQGGTYLKMNGDWKWEMKPAAVEMDQWTHFDYDAAGTGVSRDKLVRPPSAVQWRMELEPYSGLTGNPAAYRPYTGFRLSGGRAFFGLNAGKETDGKRETQGSIFAVARDAFNGLPLWRVPQISAGNGTSQEYQFVANSTRVFTFLAPGTFPVAIDAATGEVLTTFDKGAQSITKKPIHPAYCMLRATEQLLLQCAEDKLFALDANTGALKWSWEEKNGFVCFPRILEKDKRVLVQIVEANLARIQGRWANIKTSAILCLNLETGKQIWRSADTADLNFGQMIVSGDAIYGFNPAGIGATEGDWGKNPKGLVAKFSAVDGKLLWKSTNFTWGYNLIVRDGAPYFASPNELSTLGTEDGKISAFWKASFNNRCNRTSATPDWFIMGMGNYVNRDGVATVKGVARGGCAQGVVPANGLTYFTPNICHCITMLRGHLALSSESLREPVADAKRLEKSGAFSTDAGAKPTDLTGRIAAEWLPQIWYGAFETVTVKHGEREIVSVIHEQRVECRENAKAIWSFTAGARVSQPPIVEDGRCYFGAHDGWLYCLNAADGKLQWRFLAAPYERNFISHGQVESSWPVYNAVLHDGKICCTAGLHPETGGGIYAWGLDPKTGAIAWRKRFQRTELIVKLGGKIPPNRVMNSPLKIEGDQLAITGLTFTPAEPDSEIQKRIDVDSMGDKNRNWGWSLRGPIISTKK